MAKGVPSMLCIGGLTATGYGLWSLSPSIALIVAGVLCVAVGVDQYRRNAKEAKK